MYEISTYSALKICQIEVDFFLPHAGHIWEIYIIKFFKYFRPRGPGFVKGNKSKKNTGQEHSFQGKPCSKQLS